MITAHTDSVSLPVLQPLSTSIGPPGHLVSPVQPSPAGAHPPGLRPSNTPGPLHPLIHLMDLSSFISPYPLHLPPFLSTLCTMHCFRRGWDDEQDEYFPLNPCLSQDYQCASFSSKCLFMSLNGLFYWILCLYLFTVLSNFAVSLCCYSNILPFCFAWCAVLCWFC